MLPILLPLTLLLPLLILPPVQVTVTIARNRYYCRYRYRYRRRHRRSYRCDYSGRCFRHYCYYYRCRYLHHYHYHYHLPLPSLILPCHPRHSTQNCRRRLRKGILRPCPTFVEAGATTAATGSGAAGRPTREAVGLRSNQRSCRPTEQLQLLKVKTIRQNLAGVGGAP